MRDVVEIGMGKTAQRGYHLDDIAIVPSRRTRDVDDVSTTSRMFSDPSVRLWVVGGAVGRLSCQREW